MSFWRHGGRLRGIHYQSKLTGVFKQLTVDAQSEI